MKAVHKEVDGWSTLMMELAQVSPHWISLTKRRQAILQHHGLPDTAFLSWSSCEEVLRRLQVEWQSELSTTAAKADMRRRRLRPDDVQRALTSSLKHAMYQRFGGVCWATWYIAIGDLPAEIFDLARDYMAQRVSKEPARHGKHPEPSSSLKRVRGASHGLGADQESEAKGARRNAARLSRRLKQAQTWWDQGEWKMSRTGWDLLKEKHEAQTVTLLRFDSVLLVVGYCRTAMLDATSGPSCSSQGPPRPERITSPEAVAGLPVGEAA
jgi:hypothetical protein